MKAVQAEYTTDPKEIKIKENAEIEEWPAVCRKFEDDVERVCDVDHIPGYTGLYQCFDEKNNKTYYLVNEDKNLFRMRRKNFLDNIGYTD
ncbi:MAG TPA: hypothetical protein DHV36_08955 [Desulfobacteraceae bacterium]|nr:hypothetical protein [Desulfobacteraceae bacterium]|tara:strand:+ start:1261 stop:1530 length:270 start_codon:yes stop_codon:yes gene_type:complete